MLGKPAGIDPPPHALDIVRILPFHVARKNIFAHLRDEMRRERHTVSFAQPGRAIVGLKLDEDEIAPAEVRRRIADHEGLDAGQFHAP